MRTNFRSLLNHKWGIYGPLWLFQLDQEAWAIVWETCLEDDEACRLILDQDPNWFNRGWGRDGRRPNPTYTTLHEALSEVIRLLWEVRADFGDEHEAQSRYATYIAQAEHDLHQLSGIDSECLDAGAVPPGPTAVFAGAEAQGAAMAIDVPGPSNVAPEHGIAVLAPCAQAVEVKTKPWEDLSHGAKGLNLPMSPELYAKMRWCSDNIPKMSLQKLARLGAEKMADELIAKHYRPEIHDL